MTTKPEHKEGPPWKSVGRFDNYHAADMTRLRLLEAPDLQVKVHRCGPAGSLFSVKTRIKPELQDLARRRNKRRKKSK